MSRIASKYPRATCLFLILLILEIQYVVVKVSS